MGAAEMKRVFLKDKPKHISEVGYNHERFVQVKCFVSITYNSYSFLLWDVGIEVCYIY